MNKSMIISQKLEQLSQKIKIQIPAEYICPISQTVMQNPVIAADGHTYQKDNIMQWLKIKQTSPLTNLLLPNKTLISNNAIKSAIGRYLQQLQKIQKNKEQKSFFRKKYQSDPILLCIIQQEKDKNRQYRQKTTQKIQQIQRNFYDKKLDLNAFKRKIKQQTNQNVQNKLKKQQKQFLIVIIAAILIVFAFVHYYKNTDKQIALLKYQLNSLKINYKKLTKNIGNQELHLINDLKIKSKFDNKNKQIQNINQDEQIISSNQEDQEYLDLEERLLKEQEQILRQFYDSLQEQQQQQSSGSFIKTLNHFISFTTVFGLAAILMCVITCFAYQSSYKQRRRY